MEYFWKNALDDAIRANRGDAHHRYIQLATLGENGYPANRTVVFRGFGEDGILKMVTDRRSEKTRQVATNNAAEVCWYFTRSREQFRIRGRLSLVDGASRDAEMRLASWRALSDAAREQFYWPAPGEPVDTAAAPSVDAETPPDDFLLVVLTPDRVDHLQLRPTPQRRVISVARSENWTATAVNP